MNRIVATCALGGALAIIALTGSTQAQGPAAPNGLKGIRTTPAGSFIEDEVLVQFRPGATQMDKTEARTWVNGTDQKAIHADAAGELDVVKLPIGIPLENAVDVLKLHPAVANAEPNWVYTHQATSNDTYYVNGSLWGMYG